MARHIMPYEQYDEEAILALYRSVGWTNYTDHPRMLREAFAHSLKVFAAYDGSQLIGIIRAVGDGHSVVLIQDLLVHPACQRQGVGRALIRTLLEAYGNVYQTHLLTDDTDRTVTFYRSMGFTMDADMGCRAFSICRRVRD